MAKLLQLIFISFSICGAGFQRSLSLRDARAFSTCSGWNWGSGCCSLEGVTCDSSSPSPAVVALSLAGLFAESPLKSDILPLIFRIRTLTSLDISWNYIGGKIPMDGFANLSRLVHLDTSYNNFSGSIPTQFFWLKHLQYLNLEGNNLNCVLTEIVRSLLNSSDLTTLNLQQNSFGASIPTEIGNFTNLQHLLLGSNRLTGSIPYQILNLKGLVELDLSNNSLSNQIPAEIGSLVNISFLDLGNNKFSGNIPCSILGLRNLEELWLENNFLHGEIPSRLFRLTTLRKLFVGGNNLTLNNFANIKPTCNLTMLSMRCSGLIGRIPNWISTQTRLSFLDLSVNELEGDIPTWLAAMEIESILLSDNKFSGFAPRLFNFNSYILDLSANNFSGPFPESIENATNIIILMMARNHFSGPIPNSISNLRMLGLLDLSQNQLSGSSFPDFSSHNYLRYVDISSNKLSGEIPVTFSNQILYLSLRRNNFSGSLPHSLINLSQLQILDLHDNSLTGKIPEFLSQISTLQVINLGNNFFHGSIPHTIFNLSKLQILDISNNNLTGRIPIQFGDLVAMVEKPSASSLLSLMTSPVGITPMTDSIFPIILTWKKSARVVSNRLTNIYTYLDLSNNHLVGEIPTFLGNLKDLKALNLSFNKLSGTIPTSFGGLEHIESLDLSHNKLSGSIPESLSKLNELSVLDLSNNKLVGKIPIGGQMDSMANPDYYANNSGLCGTQIKVPCLEQLSPPVPQGPREDDETTFSWIAAAIGYPPGFLVSLGILYLCRYFESSMPSRYSRHSPRR